MKNSTLFVGLFLMAFALYANERSRKHEKRYITAAEMTEAMKNAETARGAPDGSMMNADCADKAGTAGSGENADCVENAGSVGGVGSSRKIQQFYDRCAQDPVLRTAPDGFRLEKNGNAVTLVFRGDEVYAFGDFPIQKSWYPLLDRIAELMQEEIPRGMKVQIKGFSDPENALERKSTEFGKSEFGLAYARAEWLARYLESKMRTPLREFAELSAGVGVRRIEMNFQYR